jgi:ATP-binding cassette, subfamily C, bacterial CydD
VIVAHDEGWVDIADAVVHLDTDRQARAELAEVRGA